MSALGPLALQRQVRRLAIHLLVQGVIKLPNGSFQSRAMNSATANGAPSNRGFRANRATFPASATRRSQRGMTSALSTASLSPNQLRSAF